MVGVNPYEVGTPSCSNFGMYPSSRYSGLCINTRTVYTPQNNYVTQNTYTFKSERLNPVRYETYTTKSNGGYVSPYGSGYYFNKPAVQNTNTAIQVYQRALQAYNNPQQSYEQALSNYQQVLQGITFIILHTIFVKLHSSKYLINNYLKISILYSIFATSAAAKLLHPFASSYSKL